MFVLPEIYRFRGGNCVISGFGSLSMKIVFLGPNMILSVQIPYFNSISQYGRDMSFSVIIKKLREAFPVFVLKLKTQARLRHVMNLVFPLFF